MCHGGYRFPLGPVVLQVGQADVLEGWAMDVGQLLPTFGTTLAINLLDCGSAMPWKCHGSKVCG